MKKILTATLAFCIFAYALPVITVGASHKPAIQPDNSKSHTDDTEYRSAIDIWNETMQELYANAEKNAQPPEDEKQSYDSSTTVTVLIDGITRKITVRDYLIGVVAAEMPASFPIEALKAQAVAARSYMLHKLEQGAEEHEGGARLCDDYTHCTAFFDISDGGEALWGNNADYYAQRICAAVDDTDGIVAVSGGQVIAAVFHSASPDKTEDAKNVWGVSYPYLVSVSSVGGSASPNYSGTVVVKADDFLKVIKNSFPSAMLGKDPSSWIGAVRRSQSGSVLNITVGGVQIKGTQIRSMFGLNSTNFNVEFQNNEFVFTTVGTGHGVGMSQYGAREMALRGAGFDEIICHYYSGVQLMVKN